MNQNNNYTFDPITGQQMNEQVQQPIQSQNSNIYSQPQQIVQPTVNVYQQPVQPQQQNKKVNTKMLIIIAMIVVVVIAGIIFITKLFVNKDNSIINNSNDISPNVSAYEYDEILDEINIIQNRYSFKSNDNVKMYKIEDLNVMLSGKSESKEYYVNVGVYDSFEWIVKNNIYDDNKRANVNYEINTNDEILFSSLDNDGNIDIVAYGYKLDNQILGFVVSRSNNTDRLEVTLKDAKTIIYNCKETISTNKGYKSAQDKIMQYAIFGNYIIKDKEMVKAINEDGFLVTKGYTDEKTNKFIYMSMQVRFKDIDYGMFDFEGEETKSKNIDGFSLLWCDFSPEALIIMSKQDYKYYLQVEKNIDSVSEIPSIDESYKIFNTFFKKKKK